MAGHADILWVSKATGAFLKAGHAKYPLVEYDALQGMTEQATCPLPSTRLPASRIGVRSLMMQDVSLCEYRGALINSNSIIN